MPPCRTLWLPPMARVSFNLSLARLVYLSTHPLGPGLLDLMPTYVSSSHSPPPLGLPQLLLDFVSPVLFLTVFDCTFSLFHVPASLRLTAHPVSHGSCRPSSRLSSSSCVLQCHSPIRPPWTPSPLIISRVPASTHLAT